MDSSISYGTYIKTRRKELGLSQYDVSEILSISTQALSQYENDKVSINLAILGDFCKVLNVDIKHFLTKTVGKDKDLVDKNTFNPTKFSSSLLAFRTSRNYSQKGVASALNVSNNKISKWELGNSLPSLDEFLKLTEFYKVDPDEFYYSLIDSFKSPEVEIVKAKPKSNKMKYLFFSAGALIAIILGITLPLTIKSNTPLPPAGSEEEKPKPDTKKYEVTIIFEGLESLNKKVQVEEGDEIPLGELELSLEYQNQYKIIGYEVDGTSFDLKTKIYSDITLTIKLEKIEEPVETYFKVTFFDTDNLTPLGPTQNVLKGDSALAPDINLLNKVSGYEFFKWDKDFSNVRMDMNIYPILKAYETTLHFISEGEGISDFTSYTHKRYDELPVLKKDGYIFDGWFLLNNERFTKDTFLEKEMTLYAKFVLEKPYKIYFKDFPNLPLVTVNKGEVIDYDLLPKPSIKDEKFLYYLDGENIISSSFTFNYEHDLVLTPYFEDRIEYKKISDYSVEITSYHSLNESVTLDKRVTIEGKKYEYTNIKTGVLDLPKAETLIINSDWNTKFYKNFIKDAPKLKNINFLSANRYEENRALYLEKDCLSNINTLETLEFGIARDFNNNYFLFNDFGFKVNANFNLVLTYPQIFEDYYIFNFNFFSVNEKSFEVYKNITSLSFKNASEVYFLKDTLDIFPNLKELNLLDGIEKFECLNFKDLELKIIASESVKEINFLTKDDLDYYVNHAKKISFESNGELKISGEIYSNELDFKNVNDLTFLDNSSLYIYDKITFSKNTKYLNSNPQKSLVINANQNKIVDVFFVESRPLDLIASDTFKPFTGVNGKDEKDNFNFFYIE